MYTHYYDNLGRITRLTSMNHTYDYAYDFAKRLSSFKDNQYETTYDYDKGNKGIQKEEKLKNQRYTYHYQYNKESALTELIHGTNQFHYLYDELGRLKESNINGTYKTTYSYVTKGNKTSTRIEEVEDNGTKYHYTYDKLGNITEVYQDTILIHSYTYDDFSELIKEDNLIDKETIEYHYDNYGNILDKKVYSDDTNTLLKEDTYTYGDTNWQDLLTQYKEESITYDIIGNPLTIGNKTLTWMNGRELATYRDGENSVSYRYNLNGIRTNKVVNGIETKYYLEGTSILFEDRNGDVLYYIYSGDELLGFIYKDVTYYYHKNIFGDIIGILDLNYNEIVTYTYDTFGVIKNIVDNSNLNLGVINPFRYRSYYYDEETKLYYLNSRYYNPLWGRFVNADILINSNRDLISANLFQYCSDNPINYIDKQGYSFMEKVNNFFTKTSNGIKRKAKKVNQDFVNPGTMFFKSIFNPSTPITKSQNKELIIAISSSNQLNEAIKENISSNKNLKEFCYSGSTDKNDYSLTDKKALSRTVGQFSYHIDGQKMENGNWKVTVTASDVYDFDEKRKALDHASAEEKFLNWANNIGFDLQNFGIVKPYSWSVTFTKFFEE